MKETQNRQRNEAQKEWEDELMLCRSCYREIPDGTKFCPECGAPTEASAIAAAGMGQ